MTQADRDRLVALKKARPRKLRARAGSQGFWGDALPNGVWVMSGDEFVLSD
jgi:hypothetical protein